MAKIRVYELARDLNMTNKALLDKISKMDVKVGSHMSSLNDETVALIKANIFGKKTDDQEEKRVRPTVIRRRKKRTEEAEAVKETELKTEEAEVKEPEKAAAEPVEEKEVAEPVSETPPPVVEETAKEPEPAVAAEPEKAEIKEDVVEKIVQDVVEESAGIVEKAEVEEPVAEKPPEKQAPEKPVEAVVKKAAPAEVKPAEKKPAKPVKKQKKSTAAKIIKLPDMPPLSVEPPKKEAEKPAPHKKASFNKAKQTPEHDMKDIAAPEKNGRKKKGKASRGEHEEDRMPRKKGAAKKKTVVVGAQLYTGGRKKGRKGAKTKEAAVLQKTQITTPKAIKRRVKIDDTIVLSDLAKRMGIKANEMIGKLMGLGVMATVNQTIDFETAELVASEFGFEVERAAFEEETLIHAEVDKPEQLLERPPVVTIMGHVDHGKTSLLDVIRKSGIADGEAGGITQHIGAYNVTIENGRIVFLDTPGHEAFTAMRSRGAQVTDIVVLVVAADDGVMPQTVEAINHARAAEVPIIVAVNKIDKPDAEPDRVKRELSEHGILSEDWGGDTIFVHVSAKEKTGIDDLLEMILLQSEVLELKANPDKPAKGHVVESKLDSGRGPVATVLVQEGTLRTGEAVVCGVQYGKIRAMLNDQGKPVKEAGPSMPVEILGLSGVPDAGDELIGLEDEKDARQISLHRGQKQRAKDLAKSSRMSLESLFEKMEEGDVKELNLIIKADVHGSIEALKESLTKLSTSEVKIHVIHSATGTVTESDISLAAVSNAIVLGFNVRPAAKVHEMAAEENVDMRFYDIIYNAIKDIEDAMVGMMEPTYEERILGRAEVRQVFVIPKVGAIGGSFVTDGKIERGRNVRVLRDGIILYDGNLKSLKRFKDDAKEVTSGYECGIGIENYNDIKVGDIIECYNMEEIKPTLKR